MSSVTFSYWVAYSRLNPFGATRDNFHAGIIASTFINTHLRKGAKPSTPHDFMFTDTETLREKKQNEFLAFLDAVAVQKKDADI